MFGFKRNKNKNAHTNYEKNNLHGICICSRCNYSPPHNCGVPCSTLNCPICNIPLIRQGQHRNRIYHKSINENDKKYGNPEVNIELCKGCGVCINECLSDAIVMVDDKAKINNEKCINCRVCIGACPAQAIS